MKAQMKNKRLLLPVLLLVILAVAAVLALCLSRRQENIDHAAGTEASASQMPSDLPDSSSAQQAPAQSGNNEAPSEPDPSQTQSGNAPAGPFEDQPSGQGPVPVPPASGGQTTQPSAVPDGTSVPEQTPDDSQGSSGNEGPIIDA